MDNDVYVITTYPASLKILLMDLKIDKKIGEVYRKAIELYWEDSDKDNFKKKLGIYIVDKMPCKILDIDNKGFTTVIETCTLLHQYIEVWLKMMWESLGFNAMHDIKIKDRALEVIFLGAHKCTTS